MFFYFLFFPGGNGTTVTKTLKDSIRHGNKKLHQLIDSYNNPEEDGPIPSESIDVEEYDSSDFDDDEAEEVEVLTRRKVYDSLEIEIATSPNIRYWKALEDIYHVESGINNTMAFFNEREKIFWTKRYEELESYDSAFVVRKLYL